MSLYPTHTDIVSVNSLQLSIDIGPDCWNRTRTQPVLISIHLHLHDSYLDAAGASDNVRDSVHYGHLSKTVSTAIKQHPSFSGVGDVVKVATEEAFKLGGEAVAEVRVVVDIPKMILLASEFSVDVTTPAGAYSRESPAIVSITNIILPVIIGVNPPEREAKQRVIMDIIFYQRPKIHLPVDYPEIVSELLQSIETSAYMTLEKFVMEVVHKACLSSEALDAVTVRTQKPSALSFAQSSGVEITRKRSSFI